MFIVRSFALSRHPRDKYFIATKLSNFAPATWSREASIAMYRNSLKELQADTLAVKVAGGPSLSLYLDIVKNSDALFDAQTLDFYSFAQEPSVLLDDRVQYVISFRPRVQLDYALFKGKVYVDRESLSFTRAEFSLDLSEREKAVAAILRRKPAGLRFRPQEVSFLVTYRRHDNVTCLNYICNEIRFKCDWKRRLFSSSYTVRSEMVVVECEGQLERGVLEGLQHHRTDRVAGECGQETAQAAVGAKDLVRALPVFR